MTNEREIRYPDPAHDIPNPTQMTGWKEIPIQESGEPLVLLNNLDSSSRVVLSPQYFYQGIPFTGPEMYLRESAALRLVQAASSLPDGMKLVIFDSHRPLEVQQSLFDKFKEELKLKFPNLSETELIKMTEMYVSIPSADPLKPSPHATGGAVDLSILDRDGNLLDMGTPWDSFNIESQTAFFRNSDPKVHNNRKLLYGIMTNAGFTNYPEEWWHYDYGNQFWGHLSRSTPIYNLASYFKEVNDMTNETNPGLSSQAAAFQLEGPFVLEISGPSSEGSTNETTRRYILGGQQGATERFAQAQAEISLLEPNDWQEYTQRVGEILADKNLQRVDF